MEYKRLVPIVVVFAGTVGFGGCQHDEAKNEPSTNQPEATKPVAKPTITSLGEYSELKSNKIDIEGYSIELKNCRFFGVEDIWQNRVPDLEISKDGNITNLYSGNTPSRWAGVNFEDKLRKFGLAFAEAKVYGDLINKMKPEEKFNLRGVVIRAYNHEKKLAGIEHTLIIATEIEPLD